MCLQAVDALVDAFAVSTETVLNGIVFVVLDDSVRFAVVVVVVVVAAVVDDDVIEQSVGASLVGRCSF